MALIQSYPIGFVILHPDPPHDPIRTVEDGEVLRVCTGAVVEELRNAPDANEQLEIDDSTNAALVADLIDNTRSYRLLGGVLRKNGQVVTVAAEGSKHKAYRIIANLTAQQVATLRDGAADFIVALANTQTPTAAQRDRATAYALYLHLKKNGQ